ncbi:hypothetical protein VP01_1346g1 [Puccinia sorghi]|uniref:Uncharacterized protein n=1 Tax=Puccinia sorghi TaxID=27349 RepID=A0A0L6VMG7_9BASI|nr:hypothetical protein VP01_1346g1 [Puccinia sorghi]
MAAAEGGFVLCCEDAPAVPPPGGRRPGPEKASSHRFHTHTPATTTMDAPTPRVSSSLLGQYGMSHELGTGGEDIRESDQCDLRSRRRLTTTERQLSPELIIESSDGGQVTVGDSQACETEISDQYVELVAKVESDSRVKALDCSNLGDKYGNPSLPPPVSHHHHHHRVFIFVWSADLKLAQAVVDIIHNPALRCDRAPCF